MFLRPYEDAAVLTVKGKLQSAITHNPYDLHRNADALQELMVGIMKYREARDKDWVWKITDGWRTLSGMEVEEIW